MRRARGTVGTRRTRPGLWLRWIDARGRRRVRKAESDDRAAAEAELAEKLKDEDERRSSDAPTLAEFIADDFLPTWGGEVAASTVERTAPQLDRIGKRLGEKLVPEITVADVRAYVATLREDGLSVGTIRREMAVLGGVFRLAEERGLVARNPARLGKRGIRLAPPKPRRPPLLTDRQERKILAAILPKYRDAAMLILDTGLRRTTAVRLRWEDVAPDFSALLPGGDGAKRKIPAMPLTQRAKEMLRRRRRGAGRGAARVFEDVSERAFTLHWRRLRGKLGLEGYRVHDWRHQFGSRLAGLGVPLTTVADLLGHADARLAAQVYATSAPKDAATSAIRALEKDRARATPRPRARRRPSARRSSPGRARP